MDFLPSQRRFVGFPGFLSLVGKLKLSILEVEIGPLGSRNCATCCLLTGVNASVDWSQQVR